MSDVTRLVSPYKITTDRDMQFRDKLNEEAVERYREAYEEGSDLPPITVFEDNEGNLWLADGFHRLQAHREARGDEDINVVVKSGEKEDAHLYASTVNLFHGMPLNVKERRRAVEFYARHPDNASVSSRMIAQRLGCSDWLVRSVRAVMNGKAKNEEVGEDHCENSRSESEEALTLDSGEFDNDETDADEDQCDNDETSDEEYKSSVAIAYDMSPFTAASRIVGSFNSDWIKDFMCDLDYLYLKSIEEE